jgi:hypothetical protein
LEGQREAVGKDQDGNRLGEVQASGDQVVGAQSRERRRTVSHGSSVGVEAVVIFWHFGNRSLSGGEVEDR